MFSWQLNNKRVFACVLIETFERQTLKAGQGYRITVHAGTCRRASGLAWTMIGGAVSGGSGIRKLIISGVAYDAQANREIDPNLRLMAHLSDRSPLGILRRFQNACRNCLRIYVFYSSIGLNR